MAERRVGETNLQKMLTKTDAELEFILRDASIAALAMRGVSTDAESKYLDQANDASTEMGRRRRTRVDKIARLLSGDAQKEARCPKPPAVVAFGSHMMHERIERRLSDDVQRYDDLLSQAEQTMGVDGAVLETLHVVIGQLQRSEQEVKRLLETSERAR